MNFNIIDDVGLYFLNIKYYNKFLYLHNYTLNNKKFLRNRLFEKYKRDTKSIQKYINKKIYKDNFTRKNLFEYYIFNKIPYNFFKLEEKQNTVNPILSFLVDINVTHIEIIRIRATRIKKCGSCNNGLRYRNGYYSSCEECLIKKENIICDLDITNKCSNNIIRHNSKDMYEVKCIYPFFYFLKNVSFRVVTNNDSDIYYKSIGLNENSIFDIVSSLNFNFLTYQNSKLVVRKMS